MSRTPRKNVSNSSFFHIMVQGINKEYIFETKENKEKYLKLSYKNNDKIKMIAYCIMDNHAHFLVQTEQIDNLEAWMRKANTSYAIYYNKKNQRIGYVFRDRYKIQIIKNPKHLYTCIQYIHDNPVKAQIIEKCEEYEFSSYLNIYEGNQEILSNKIKNILEDAEFDNEDNVGEPLKFMDEREISKEEICESKVNQFLAINHISIKDLKKDKENLRKIVEMLRNETKTSYRIMEKFLGVSRETLRNLL